MIHLKFVVMRRVCLVGIIIYIEELEEVSSVSSEDTDTELDDHGCIPEGVPEVNIDEQGFHSLV